jgi:hypothetical protein
VGLSILPWGLLCFLLLLLLLLLLSVLHLCITALLSCGCLCCGTGLPLASCPALLLLFQDLLQLLPELRQRPHRLLLQQLL